MLMNNHTDITWEKLYKCWGNYMWNAPSILKSPIAFEEIHIEYNRDGFIYGYDWISHEKLEERKKIIENDVTQFLYFTQPSNKGTIHTLQMLLEAETSEEIAAIWIYAITFEMLQNGLQGKSRKRLHQICRVTRQFLSERFCFWHHAMRKLVPEIYTNYLFDEVEFESFESIIEIIVLNAALIRHEYTPVLYTSLKEGEHRNDYSIRLC